MKIMLLVIFALCFFYSEESKAIDEPNYTLLKQDDKFEIRHYAATVKASVTVSGTQRDAANKAFRILFKYIQGQNKAEQKIPMTAPVAQAPQHASTSPLSKTSSDTWVVDFYMPNDFTYDTTPQANNSAVEIVKTEEKTLAVLRFSGRPKQKHLDKRYAQLVEYLNENNIRIESDTPTYAYYNSPFMPGPFRRNEVMLEVTYPN